MSELSGHGHEQDPLLQAAEFSAELDFALSAIEPSRLPIHRQRLENINESFHHEFDEIYPAEYDTQNLYYLVDNDTNESVVAKSEQDEYARGYVYTLYKFADDGSGVDKCDGRAGNFYDVAGVSEVESLVQAMRDTNALIYKESGGAEADTGRLLQPLKQVLDELASGNTQHPQVEFSASLIGNEASGTELTARITDIGRIIIVKRFIDADGTLTKDSIKMHGSRIPEELIDRTVVIEPHDTTPKIYDVGPLGKPRRWAVPFRGRGAPKRYDRSEIAHWSRVRQQPERLDDLTGEEVTGLHATLSEYITDRSVLVPTRTLQQTPIKSATQEELYTLLNNCVEGHIAIKGMFNSIKEKQNGTHAKAELPVVPSKRRPYVPMAKRLTISRDPQEDFFVQITDPVAPEEISDDQFYFHVDQGVYHNYHLNGARVLLKREFHRNGQGFQTSEHQAQSIIRYIKRLAGIATRY